jgi:hypothetical protein
MPPFTWFGLRTKEPRTGGFTVMVAVMVAPR